jgi:branched-chain amino acid aminotransferase
MADKDTMIWLDGELVPEEAARVPFLAPALHYGLAAFEGIRCYSTENGSAVFRLHEHLERFLNSARIFGITDLPYGLNDLRSAVHDVITANKLNSCYIRPLVYMSSGPLGLNLDEMKASVGIAAWEWGAFLGEDAMETGARLVVSSFTRHHPNVMMTKAKISGNYANSVMAKTLACRLGFDEAIMLDPSGFVAECTGENIFLVRDGVIYTPSRATILEGITRDSILTIARDLGYQTVEEPISRDQLYIADEIFLSGTAAECVPACEVDFRPIGSGQIGPITREIQRTFFETVRGNGSRSESWLDPVGAHVIA